MIDYQKYIDALRKCAREHENDRTSTGHIIVSDLCRDTANLLEELEQESKWISVSERFPQLNELDTQVRKQKVMITGYLSFDDKKELFVSEEFINDVINNSVHDTVVTAWKPLPEPCEAESEE